MKKLVFVLLIISLVVCCSCSKATSAEPTIPNQVKITGGSVQGVAENSLTVFKGIPYAAPPVGNLRWKAPQPVKPWKGVLKADHFGPSAPQIVAHNFARLSSDVGKISEDCLYLNVWTPALQKARKNLPVMVWIHGGGFAMGSTTQANWTCEKLAEKDVVLVSLNYRLGVLGFLTHPELTAENPQHTSGNYGLLDQLAALKWVQDNITAFGGDPKNVTIFGESAGGISVSMLCASPLAKGLFKRAICESGGAFGPIEEKRMLGVQRLKVAEQNGLDLAQRVGAKNLAELRQIPIERFIKDKASVMGGLWPVCDGYVITDDAYKLYKQGKYNDVDVLIGTNSNEGATFVQGPVHKEAYLQYVKLFGPLEPLALKVYPGTTDAEALASMRNIVMDTIFAWPTYTWARLQSQTGKGRVYVYYFNRNDAENNAAASFKGAAHSDEINYVFGHINTTFNAHYTDKDRALSAAMMSYWTNFAKTGNPNAPGLPAWPRYKEGADTIMYLDPDQVQAGPQPNLARLQLLDIFFNAIHGLN